VRHAHLYTNEEVRDWYSKDGNSINCKCSQQSVLVDADGKPEYRTPSRNSNRNINRCRRAVTPGRRNNYAYSGQHHHEGEQPVYPARNIQRA
jgi:hypothetical protein